GSLPHFDGVPEAPSEVLQFRKMLSESDGVLLCSPEYAFGLPGTLKNAIDWTVSSGELVNKPIALITAATGGDKAHAAWLQVFTALSAHVDDECALLLPFIRSKMTGHEVTDEATLQQIYTLLDKFVALIPLADASGNE
ncbi:MAG: NADPH-dependent oxidoreductase, partial [Chitinophagia bacterium]|nr:NADPH-dependent oxidoreductase [Chitinophagia bacterium]